MTDESKEVERSSANTKQGSRLGRQILWALVLGVLCGIFFGDYVGWTKLVGDVYIGLMQMTVLPYIIVALVASIGRLSFRQGKALFGRGLLFLLLLWAIGLATVLLTGLSFPPMESGAFFSTNLLQEPPSPNFLGLFVPFNVFNSIVQDVVPAVVVFCIFLGIALMGVPEKRKVIDVLDVLQQALMQVNVYVAKLTPIGVFGMVAAASGTMTVEEFGRIQGYLIAYTLVVCVLTFWVLPAIVAALTPIGHRDVLRVSRTALVTAFATGKVLIVLPMLIEETKELFAQTEADPERAAGDIDVLYPLAYSFPHLGKLMGLMFIPFAAWFLGQPLGLFDYPMFLSTGVLTYFGGPLAATPFLLSLMGLPSDMMQLFLVSGIWTARLGDLLGAMHLMTLTILTTAALTGILRVDVRRLVRGIAVSAGLLVACLVGTSVYLKTTFEGSYRKDDVLASLNSLGRPELFEVIAVPTPHETPLEAGDQRLDRVQANRIVRVGFDPDRRPFCFRNPRGELVGLDIEMAQAFADATGVKVQLVEIDVDDAARHLREDHVDIVIGGLIGLLVRAETSTLSATYLDAHPALVVLEDRAAEVREIDLADPPDDFVIAVADEAILETIRRGTRNIRVRKVDSAQTFFASEEPLADALVTTAEAGFAWALAYPRYDVIIPEDLPRALPLVFMLPRGEPSLERYVNQWIEVKTMDGTIGKFYEHWVLGKTDERRAPRWSVIQNVLGWVD